MSRLAETFARLQQHGRKALIPFIPAGWPQAQMAVPLLHILANAGADAIELGVPFSDPSADGPTIQAASEQALRQGTGLPQILEMVRQFREDDTRTPIILMGYANPIERYDALRHPGAFAEAAASAGVDGVLVVDYPPEVSHTLAAQLRQVGIDLIFLLAPTSTDARIRDVAERASGYVYCVSIKGITGSTQPDLTEVENLVARVRQHVHLPIGVGFGIRNLDTAREVAQLADAVIIGSWLIEHLADQPITDALNAARTLIRDIRQQLDRHSPKPFI